MSVMTFFCLGTCSNSFDFANPDYASGELVSTLARNHSGMEFIDWVVLDGPGSGNFQEDEKWVKPGNYMQSRGAATGAGWEENVQHAIALLQGKYKWKRTQYTEKNLEVFHRMGRDHGDEINEGFAEFIGDIKVNKHWIGKDTLSTDRQRVVTQQDLQAQKIKIFRKNKPVTHVNLIGWSRGGVTCHMLANAMFQVEALQNIPVHIFAVDPVPGLGRFQEHRTTLQRNVKNYFAIYAEDERSKGFDPILPDVSAAPDVTLPRGTLRILPMPGRHGTLVGNASETGGGGGGNAFPEVGKIVRHLAEFTLNRWGTEFHFNKKLNLNNFEILRLYENILKQKRRGKFEEMRKHVYTWKRGDDAGRYVGIGADWTSTPFSKIDLLSSDPAFVNWHHRGVFVNTFGEPKNIKNMGTMMINSIKLRFPVTMKSIIEAKQI